DPRPGAACRGSSPAGAVSSRPLIAFRHQEVPELPRVGPIELWSVETLEDVRIMLERIPIRSNRDERAQVRLADVQHVIMGKVVWYTQALARVLEHPQASGDNGDGNLHGGRVLVRHQPARLIDVEI